MQRPVMQCREHCAPSTSYSLTSLRQHNRLAAPFLRRRALSQRLASSDTRNGPVGDDLGWSTEFQKHFVRGRVLGAGSFGTVYLGIDLRTGEEVAVKVLPKIRGKLTKERTLAKIHKEASILSRLQDCANVVQLLGLFENSHEVLVVTEVCKGGDLQRLFESHRSGLSERSVALIGFEVLRVVAACHSMGILHGDIKPANFVLKHPRHNPVMMQDECDVKGPWLKAIDFGCGQLVDSMLRFTKRSGTPVYMAPEIYNRNYSYEADVWSLGIMLYQLVTHRFPFWDTFDHCQLLKIEEVATAVLHQPVPFKGREWQGVSKECVDFIASCLVRDFSCRMSVQEALQHKWFRRFLPCDENGQVVNNIVQAPPPQQQQQAVRMVLPVLDAGWKQ